jgi:transposase
MNVFIYTLEDKNGNIRYVGKTNNLKIRYSSHIRLSKKENTHKSCWIKSLLKNDEYPIMNILDEVDVNEWEWWEIYWISQIKTWGFSLTNIESGGNGPNRISEETRKKLSNSHIGKPNSNKGKKLPIEITRKNEKYDPIEIQKLLDDGLFNKEIAEKMGTFENIIYNYIKKYNLIKNDIIIKKRRGEIQSKLKKGNKNNLGRKWSDEDKNKQSKKLKKYDDNFISNILKTELSITNISKKYNIPRRTIYRYIKKYNIVR